MTTDLSGRLTAAALSLVGPGPIKDRLLDAYCTHLEDIRESDLPALRHEFADMTAALHRERALPGEHVVRASVRKLSRQQACYYAELVVRLYGTLAGLRHEKSGARAAIRV